MAIIWAAEAWASVTQLTMVNCWNSVGIFPNQGQQLCPEAQHALDELQTLLVELSTVTREPLCTIEDCSLAGEEIVEDPDICSSMESSDEIGVEEAPDVDEEESGPAGGTSRGLSLQEARAAALSLFNFVLDNQDQALCRDHTDDAKRILDMLQRMTITSRHQQLRMDAFLTKE